MPMLAPCEFECMHRGKSGLPADLSGEVRGCGGWGGGG